MDIVIFGNGQLADVVAEYVEQHAEVRIAGYTVDSAYRRTDTFRGLPLVDWEELERHFPPDQVQLFGPISYRDGNRFRRDRFEEGRSRGYRFYSFVHPDSRIYTQDIGENVLILEGNTLQPFSAVGDNCILWSNNHIGHHTSLGAHCFLTSQVGLGGNTRVGEGVFFAGQSGAIDNLEIGDWCLLSPNAVATADMPADSILAAPKPRLVKGVARRSVGRLLG